MLCSHFYFEILINDIFFVFSVLFRASGTVYTAIDVATGQEVSAARVPQQWILDCVLKVQVDATKYCLSGTHDILFLMRSLFTY